MAEPARIEPWSSDDHDLLLALLGDPAMMVHLGGPETAAAIAERQTGYEASGSRQYRVVDVASGTPAGWVGYWHSTREDEPIFEIGWAILPGLQGRGLARSGTKQLIAQVHAEPQPLPLFAFPAVTNAASNALCRSLGFALLGPEDFEYPPGHTLHCNVWRLGASSATHARRQ